MLEISDRGQNEVEKEGWPKSEAREKNATGGELRFRLLVLRSL